LGCRESGIDEQSVYREGYDLCLYFIRIAEGHIIELCVAVEQEHGSLTSRFLQSVQNDDGFSGSKEHTRKINDPVGIVGRSYEQSVDRTGYARKYRKTSWTVSQQSGA